MFALLAVISLMIFLTIAWFDFQAGNTGAIDMAIMGGTLAGGAFAAFTTIIGKEQRKVTDR